MVVRTKKEVRRADGPSHVWIADGRARMPIVADVKDIKAKVAAEFLRDVVFEMTGVRPAIVAAADGPAVASEDHPW